jgi:hypothetical protein
MEEIIKEVRKMSEMEAKCDGCGDTYSKVSYMVWHYDKLFHFCCWECLKNWIKKEGERNV